MNYRETMLCRQLSIANTFAIDAHSRTVEDTLDRLFTHFHGTNTRRSGLILQRLKNLSL